MLDEQDIKKIGEELGKVIEDNITPALDKIHERLDTMGGQIEDIRKTIANLPDKDYFDDKLANLSGEVVVREKKQDQKVNLLIDAVDKQRIMPENIMAPIKAIHVFPSPPLAQ